MNLKIKYILGYLSVSFSIIAIADLILDVLDYNLYPATVGGILAVSFLLLYHKEKTKEIKN